MEQLASRSAGSGTGSRLVTLDVIRGVAVMGIFSVNVIAFAMIESAYLNPGMMGGHSGENLAIWLANYIVIDGKMRSLFSMLFGASMLLVIDRAAASGQSPARVHYARMIVLALFGLFHFYVIWFGDILFLYAVTGMVAFFFRKRRVKTLLAWAGGLFAVSMVLMTAASLHFRSLDVAAHAPAATPRQIHEWNQAIRWGAVSPQQVAEEVALHRATIDVRTRHMVTERRFEPFTSVPFILPETLALMLLGMAAYRSGFFGGEWDDARYRKVAAWGLSIGAAGGAILGLVDIRFHFYLPLLFFNFLALGTPLRVIMALGYAALIILATRRPGWLKDRLAAVGRTAFSNYLGTSILAALIFFGDGLSLFARLSRFEAWLFAPLFWLLMLAWSKPWLDRFAYGPFEWLWRSLARWKIQPFRKRLPASAAAAEA
jgi:uncharacterized protein